MLILYSSDLHGKLVLYKKLLFLVRERKPSVLILGGDLLPKSCSEKDLLSIQRSFIQGDLLEFFIHLHTFHNSLRIGLMLGNDDFSFLRTEMLLLEEKGLFQLIDNKQWTTYAGWHVIGFNLVPETPFALKDLERRDCHNDPIRYPSISAVYSAENSFKDIDASSWFSSHPTLSEELAKLPQMLEPEKTIFVAHSPPYGTPLDVMINGQHVGSRAIRRYIENKQPLISLHGHIHESFFMTGNYFTQLGNTICFNPGQIHYPFLDAIFIDTDSPMSSNEHIGKVAQVSEEGLNLLKAPLC